MQTSIKGIAYILIATIFGQSIVGCAGIRAWDKGKFYHCELRDGIKTDELRSVGVYVFSDGATQDGWDPPYDAVDYLDFGTSLITAVLTIGTVGYRDKRRRQYELDRHFFAPEIERHSIFDPDTTNAGPSLELATKIKEALDERGYAAKVVTDLGHNSDISVDQILKDAKAKGLDAVFITYYTGLDTWRSYGGSTYAGYRTQIITVNRFNGFLYLPNSTFFDTATGDILWSNSYYGLVEKAHLPNLQSDPFNEVVPEAVIFNGAETYFKAAPLAITLIFAPPLWPGSFKQFPVRGDRKKHL